MVVISVINQKGGVGKTTATVNMAGVFARDFGMKVLVVDADPQANATATLYGGYLPNDKPSLYEVLGLKDDALPLERAVVKVNLDAETTIDLLPSHLRLAQAEADMASASFSDTRLADALQQSSLSYDVVLIDCPPSLGKLVTNALVAADYVVIPFEAGMYAILGMRMLIATIERVNAYRVRQINRQRAIAGLSKVDSCLSVAAVFLTKAEPHLQVHKAAEEFLRTKYPQYVLVDESGNWLCVPKRTMVEKQVAAAQKEGGPRDMWAANGPDNDVTAAYRKIVAQIVKKLSLHPEAA